MPDKSLHYVELPALSLERAMDFYRQVLGWEFEQPPAEHEVPDVVYLERTPEVGLKLGGTPDPEGGVRPAVAVDSIDDVLLRAVDCGGRVLDTKVDVGDGYTGAFADSEGNRMGLWEFK